MSKNLFVAFVEKHVDWFLDSANHAGVLPISEELARHFLIGVKGQLLGCNAFVIRAKHEHVESLRHWICQNGIEKWFRFENEVFRINDQMLTPEDKVQIISALRRLFPAHLHSTPGKFGMFVMKVRKLLRFKNLIGVIFLAGLAS